MFCEFMFILDELKKPHKDEAEIIRLQLLSSQVIPWENLGPG
jgi:hypothetical protein